MSPLLAARLRNKDERLEVLRAAHRGGGKAAGFDVPSATIETVAGPYTSPPLCQLHRAVSSALKARL